MKHVGHIFWGLRFLVLFGHYAALTSCAWLLTGDMDHAASFRAAAEQAYTRMLPAAMHPENAQIAPAFTLEQCREMALANNLSLHIAKLEQANRTHFSWAEWSKMLPHVILAAKFDQGDNIVYSDLPGDSYWSEFYARSSWHLFLETRWSPTDVAIAYYTARNAANRSGQSFYEKARLGQKIIETVDVSFFRLLAVQECLPLARELVSLRSDVANRLERLLHEKLVAPDDYEKALNDEMKAHYLEADLKVESERHANALAVQLSRARKLNGKAHDFMLKGNLTRPEPGETLKDPELIALKNRPEIAALGLKKQESSNDFRKAILRNFPRVSLFWRYLKDPYHDRGRRDGQQAGLLLYVDLVDSLSQFKESQSAYNQRIKSELELNAVALAVASQASIAAKKYLIAADKAALRAKAIAASERALKAAQQRAEGRHLSGIAEKKARADLIAEKIELTRALGEANACLAELKSALGTNHSVAHP